MRSIAILPLALLGAAPLPSDPAQTNPAERVVFTQPATERRIGQRFLDRLRGSKTTVPPPKAAKRAIAERPNLTGLRGDAPTDPPVRRAQDTPGLPNPLTPNGVVPFNAAAALAADASSQPITMEAALYGAITQNPDLVALRQGNEASAEAVEVARRFPTTLNPTLWIDVRPFAYERAPGGIGPNGGRTGAHLDQKDALMYFSLRQPIELGHQTTHRHSIAKAAYSQQQWTVLQAELTAIVQTYRLFQTAAYRREKLRVAQQLAEFNEKLVTTLKGRLEVANQIQAADVALAEVEAGDDKAGRRGRAAGLRRCPRRSSEPIGRPPGRCCRAPRRVRLTRRDSRDRRQGTRGPSPLQSPRPSRGSGWSSRGTGSRLPGERRQNPNPGRRPNL